MGRPRARPSVAPRADEEAVPRPDAVQARAIPLVLAGKDVVARAHTGSKTAAYLLPAIHKIMQSDVSGAPAPNPRALVLVPTRELAHQVKKEAAFILGKCAPEKRAGGSLPPGAPPASSASSRRAAGGSRRHPRARRGVRPRRPVPPDALRAGLELLVLDEADLLLSFGYEDNIRAVVQAVHRGCQCMLLSATSGGDELARLQALVLHHPVHLDVGDDASAKRSGENRSGESGAIAEDAPSNAVGPRVSHAVVKCPAKDKLLYVMALLRLGLCRRKCLVFVKDPDAAVRLRLFLDKFGVPCCALHAELGKLEGAHLARVQPRRVRLHDRRCRR